MWGPGTYAVREWVTGATDRAGNPRSTERGGGVAVYLESSTGRTVSPVDGGRSAAKLEKRMQAPRHKFGGRNLHPARKSEV